MSKQKQKMTLTLTVDQINLLKTYAEEHDLSASAVIRMMINKAFKKKEAV